MDEEYFKKKLNPEQYRIMREKGNEAAYSGTYWDHREKGTYLCAACGTHLFSSRDKFDSGSGWPSFKKPMNERALEFKKESANKAEVRCGNCKSHLGYVVSEGKTPHYRINSAALSFEGTEGMSFDEMKDRVEDVQDFKEKLDERKSKDESQPSLLQTIAFILTGIFIGAASMAGLAISGRAPLLCPANQNGVMQTIAVLPRTATSTRTPAALGSAAISSTTAP